MDGSMGWEKVGQWAVAVLGALGGLKVFQFLKNWGTDSRKERASAEERELEVLRKHNEWLGEHYNERTEENTRLRDEVMLWKDKYFKAKSKECLVPNDKCLRRIPQTTECRMREWMIKEYKKDVPGVVITNEDMATPYKEGEAEEIMKDVDDEEAG